MGARRFPFGSRLAAVRAVMAEAGLDAFVVTHPSNLQYLTGFTGSTGALVIERGHRGGCARCHLVVDFRYVTSSRELSRHPDLSSLEIVKSDRSEDEAIVALVRQAGFHRIGIEAAWMSVARFNQLSTLLAGATPTPMAPGVPCPVLVAQDRVVERGRVVKDAEEVDVLRTAAKMLSAVAREVVPTLVRAGLSEAEVAAGIDGAIRAGGFARPAFETIVASGPNAALPHARPGPRILTAGDPVVLDFGGVYDGYCVDLTRTVQLAPSSDAFRRLFAAVAEAHDAAVAAVRPGASTADIDYAARHALDRHGLADAFGHGTGHGLGLDVHEEPRISKADPSRTPARVEAGMVFTIEPGVYLPGVGGVRIEDDVLVVDGGCDVLTDVPIEL